VKIAPMVKLFPIISGPMILLSRWTSLPLA